MERTGFGICICSLVLFSGCLASISVEISTNEPLALGDNVTFHCRVEDFPAGGVVTWWKRQGSEEVKLGENASLIMNIDRYSLDLTQSNTTTLFYLNIRGIKPEDNGDFGCSLSDDDEKVFKNLVFSDPVQVLQFNRVASANSNEVIHSYSNDEEFNFNEDEEYYFICVASGSNPSPEIVVSIGYGDDVNSLNKHFIRHERLISDMTSGDSDMTSGEKAFRKTNYEAWLVSANPLSISWKNNSQELKCSASVANMAEPSSVVIKPILKISPVIECVEEVKAPLWKEDITLKCNVYADPPLQDICWYWGNDYRETKLLPGEWLGAYSFYLDEGSKPGMKVARLTIDRTFIHMYLQYNLTAKNEKGLTNHTLTLVRDINAEYKKPSSGSQITITSAILILSCLSPFL